MIYSVLRYLIIVPLMSLMHHLIIHRGVHLSFYRKSLIFTRHIFLSELGLFIHLWSCSHGNAIKCCCEILTFIVHAHTGGRLPITNHWTQRKTECTQSNENTNGHKKTEKWSYIWSAAIATVLHLMTAWLCVNKLLSDCFCWSLYSWKHGWLLLYKSLIQKKNIKGYISIIIVS